MIAELLLSTAIALLVYAFYKWATLNNDYFAKRNFPFQKPSIASLAMFFNTPPLTELSRKLYNSFPNEKMYGMIDRPKPFLVVRDPELLKQLAVKDFDHFEDHRHFVDPESDVLFGNSLMTMKGQRWRDMRATLSPAFTGSKMRQMFELVSECADEMAKYFVEEATEGQKIDFEIKDMFSRYTNDVIASCAFGIRVNSLQDKENEFFVAGSNFMNLNGPLAMIKFVFMSRFPRLAKKLDCTFIKSSVSDFFSKAVLDTMNERQKRDIFRPDMINMLMKLRKGENAQETGTERSENASNDSAGFATVAESSIHQKGTQRQWNDTEIIAQCFLFFLAGFETTSTTLTFLTYELCLNSDVQQKLFEEIMEMNNSLGGKRITYDSLQKMKYMDQVISESLRKWPAVPLVDRLCVKEYLCEYDDAKFLFEEGVGFMIPIYGFHHDPKFYPEPDRFDPERFSEENKNNIVPGTYMPFGVGPRNCIGSRFALMEIKAVLYYLLLNFSLVPNAKTQIPLRLRKSLISVQAENGVHMELVLRRSHPECQSHDESTL